MSGNKNTLSNIYNSCFRRYLKHSELIGGTIHDQSVAVDNVFKISLELEQNFQKYRRPVNSITEQYIIEPLLHEIENVKIFEAKASDSIFQITLICKSIKIFEWVREADVQKFISKLNKYVQFYQQKAQAEIEHLDIIHFEWLKNWNEVYEEFSNYILNYYKNGITWLGSISMPITSALGDAQVVQKSQQHRALFQDISKGELIQNILQHPAIPEEPKLPHVFNKSDQKWLIQNHKDNHKGLVVNTAKKEEAVLIYNCLDCTIVIENIINALRVDLCKKVTVLLRQTSTAEVVDCKDCNIHCFDKIASLDLSSCENCGLYLSDRSLDTNITSTKCTGTNISFPFEDGIYKTFKISNKLLTKILPNCGIETTINQ